MPTRVGVTVMRYNQLYEQNRQHDDKRDGSAQHLSEHSQQQDKTKGRTVKKGCFH